MRRISVLLAVIALQGAPASASDCGVYNPKDTWREAKAKLDCWATQDTERERKIKQLQEELKASQAAQAPRGLLVRRFDWGRAACARFRTAFAGRGFAMVVDNESVVQATKAAVTLQANCAQGVFSIVHNQPSGSGQQLLDLYEEIWREASP